MLAPTTPLCKQVQAQTLAQALLLGREGWCKCTCLRQRPGASTHACTHAVLLRKHTYACTSVPVPAHMLVPTLVCKSTTCLHRLGASTPAGTETLMQAHMLAPNQTLVQAHTLAPKLRCKHTRSRPNPDASRHACAQSPVQAHMLAQNPGTSIQACPKTPEEQAHIYMLA